MRGPNQDILHGEQPPRHGEQPPRRFSVPKPHNDVAPTPGQPKPSALKDVLWLLPIILGLILTVIWAGVLGWLAVRLVIWLLR